METFAARLRGLKEDRRVLVKEIAEACGVIPLTVHNWLSGKMPRGTHLARLAAYFDVTTDYLLNGDPAGIRTELIEKLNANFPHLTTSQLVALLVMTSELAKKN